MAEQTLHSSKSVEHLTGYSGNTLRNLARSGWIKPVRDTNGRYLYTDAQVKAIIGRRDKILAHRAERATENDRAQRRK